MPSIPNRSVRGMHRQFGLVSLLLVTCLSAAAGGQSSASPPSMRAGVFVGTELEDYLRTLQTFGLVRYYPWSIRSLSPRELDDLRPSRDDHPWRNHAGLRAPERSDGPRWEVVPVRVDGWYNSSFPSGMNDGAVWKGRGLTTAAHGGIAARWGPFSLSAAPVVFWAQNQSFPLLSNGQAGNLRYADGEYWQIIDRPQRFGDRPYARVDLGQSTARLDVVGVAAGISSASQWWGPMSEYPFILGDNAGGFPHVFFGLSRPWKVWFGRLHARVMYGRLEQTAYTNIGVDSTVRFAAAIIAVFSPRGIPGLEVGAARFYHVVWPEGGIGSSELGKPFEGILKASLPRGGDVPGSPDPGQSSDNQLASIFARWVMPSAGLELYGEYGREDHSWNSRDLVLELDHSATYGVGLRKAWKRADERITLLRAELMNYQIPLLLVHRAEGGIYLHTIARQGHTHRGQLLGSGLGVSSGSGTLVGIDRYSRNGRLRAFWSRVVRLDPRRSTVPATRRAPNATDVQHLLGVERSLSAGMLTFNFGMIGTYELNRDLRRDTGNVAIEVGATWWP